MTVRRSLPQLASTGARLATTRRFRVVSHALLFGGLAFVLVRLRSIWHDSHIDLRNVDWTLFACAVLVSACSMAATGFVWLAILRRLGVKTESWFAGIFLQAQVSKYIPGSLWQYAGRATLARASGLALRPVALSIPIELIAAALAGAASSLLFLGVWGIPGTVAAALVLSAFAYPVLEQPTTAALRRAVGGKDVRGVVAAGVRAVGPYVFILTFTGFGFWLTARALFDVPLADVLTYTGAFVIAWLGGLIAFYAPGGIGVREAILVALLRDKVGDADALVLAAGSRGMLTAVDVFLAFVGAAIVRARGGRESLAGPHGSSDVESRSSF